MLAQKKKRYLLSALIFFFLCLGTAAGFFLLKNSQDIRQQASTQKTCSTDPSDPYYDSSCTCEYKGSSLTCTTDGKSGGVSFGSGDGGSGTSKGDGSLPQNLVDKGLVNTTHSGDRPSSEGSCSGNGMWMNSFCYMPGDEFAGGKVVLASGRYNYPYIEDKKIAESVGFGAENISKVIGSTNNLGDNCGGKGLAVNNVCYSYGSTVNGYLIMPARTVNCDNASGNYCYPHLKKIEVNYADWQKAVQAYEKSGNLNELEKLYQKTYGISFNPGSLYNAGAANAELLKAQAILSALTNATVLKAQAQAQNDALSKKGNLTAEEQKTFTSNLAIINDAALENRYQYLDQLNEAVASDLSTSAAINKMYAELITADGTQNLSDLAKNKFAAIFGYDPLQKYGNLDGMLKAFGLSESKLQEERANFAQKQAEAAAAAATTAQKNAGSLQSLREKEYTDTFNRVYNEYLQGGSDLNKLREAAWALGLISGDQAKTLSEQATFALILKATEADLSGAQLRQRTEDLSRVRETAIKTSQQAEQAQSLTSVAAQYAGDSAALYELYTLYTEKTLDKRVSADFLRKEIAKYNASVALDGFAKTQDTSYLQIYADANLPGYKNYYAAAGTTKGLLTLIYGQEAGNSLYKEIVVPNQLNEALNKVSRDGGAAVKALCQELKVTDCSFKGDGVNTVALMLDKIYESRNSDADPHNDVNIAQLATDYAIKLAQKSKADSVTALKAYGSALQESPYNNYWGASGTSFKIEDYPMEALGDLRTALNSKTVFNEFTTYNYAKQNTRSLEDYTFGLAYGSALMADNIFVPQENSEFSKKQMGLNLAQAGSIWFNQMSSQIASVDVAQNIAANYAGAIYNNYAGPADTRIANAALTGLNTLNQQQQFLAPDYSYNSAASGYYVHKNAANVVNAIGGFVVQASAFSAATSLNQAAWETGQSTWIDPVEYAKQAKADFKTNHLDKAVTSLYSKYIQDGQEEVNLASYQSFMADSEIQRSREQLSYERVEKIVAPTAAVVILPAMMLSGVAAPVALGMSSSLFSLYQGAGLKAQSLELQRIDTQTRVNALVQEFQRSGGNELEVKNFEKDLNLQIEAYNKQGNILLASSAVAALTSTGGWMSHLGQMGQTAGLSSNLAQGLVSSGQILSKSGQVASIGLSSYSLHNSTAAAIDAFRKGNTVEGLFSSASAISALSGVLGNSFNLVGSNSVTNVIDFAGDWASGVGGLAVDIQQVSQACYSDQANFSQQECVNAWIGLALSTGQNISQISASTKARNADIATSQIKDWQQQLEAVETRLLALLDDPHTNQEVLKTFSDQHRLLTQKIQTADPSFVAKVNLSDNLQTVAQRIVDELQLQYSKVQGPGVDAEVYQNKIELYQAEIGKIASLEQEIAKIDKQVSDLGKASLLSGVSDEVGRLDAQREALVKTLIQSTEQIAGISTLDQVTHKLVSELQTNTAINDVRAKLTNNQAQLSLIEQVSKNLSLATDTSLSEIENRLIKLNGLGQDVDKILNDNSLDVGAKKIALNELAEQNKPGFWQRVGDLLSPERQVRQAYSEAVNLVEQRARLVIDDPNVEAAKLDEVDQKLLKAQYQLAASVAAADQKNLVQAAKILGTGYLKLQTELSQKDLEIKKLIAAGASEEQIAEARKLMAEFAEQASSALREVRNEKGEIIREPLVELVKGSFDPVTKKLIPTRFEVTTAGEANKLNQRQFALFNNELASYETYLGKVIQTERYQDVYLFAELEAFAAGRRGTIFGALPGMGKTDIIIPFNLLLKQRLTGDPQFMVFSESKLMKPWIVDDQYTPNKEFISYVEERFGEGSVLIIKPNESVDLDVLARAKFIITTKEVAFKLEDLKTADGQALRNKWRNAYIHSDEVDISFDPNEHYRLTEQQVALKNKAEYQLLLEAQKRILGVGENGEFLEGAGLEQIKNILNKLISTQSIPEEIIRTADGKGGRFTETTEKAILNDWLAINKLKIEGLDFSQDSVADVKAKIDQYLSASDDPNIRRLRAETTIINETANLLSRVPHEDYELNTSREVNSIAPTEKSKETGRSYGSVVEQLLYNTVGARILGVENQIDLSKISVGQGGNDITYARLMLEGKGFSFYSGTPELVAGLFKMYGVELTSFTDTAISTVESRIRTSDLSSLFAGEKALSEQVKNRFAEGRNQVYINMAEGVYSNDVALQRLADTIATEVLSQAKTDAEVILFRVGANGEFQEYRLGIDGQLSKVGKVLTDVEVLNTRTKALNQQGSRYVKFYDYGAHVGVDTYNDVDLSRAVGLCYVCDETTFAQGIGRVRPDISQPDKFAPIDVVWLDAPNSVSNSKTLALNDFFAALEIKQSKVLALAELNFKETLLRDSLERTILELVDLTSQGKKGFLGIGAYSANQDLSQKLIAAEQEWKELTGMNYRLGSTDISPEAKLEQTAAQVRAMYGQLTELLAGSGAPARLLATRADGAVGNKIATVKFEDGNYEQLSGNPSYRQVVDLINKSSSRLELSDLTLADHGADPQVIKTRLAENINDGNQVVKPGAAAEVKKTTAALSQDTLREISNPGTLFGRIANVANQIGNDYSSQIELTNQRKDLTELLKQLPSSSPVVEKEKLEQEITQITQQIKQNHPLARLSYGLVNASTSVSQGFVSLAKSVGNLFKTQDQKTDQVNQVAEQSTDRAAEDLAAQRQAAYQALQDQFVALNTNRPAINNEEDYQVQSKKLEAVLKEIEDLQRQSGLTFVEIAADGSLQRVNRDQFSNLSIFRARAEAQIDKNLASSQETISFAVEFAQDNLEESLGLTRGEPLLLALLEMRTLEEVDEFGNNLLNRWARALRTNFSSSEYSSRVEELKTKIAEINRLNANSVVDPFINSAEEIKINTKWLEELEKNKPAITYSEFVSQAEKKIAEANNQAALEIARAEEIKREEEREKRKLEVRWQAIKNFVERVSLITPRTVTTSVLQKNISIIERLIQINQKIDFSTIDDQDDNLSNLKALAEIFVTELTERTRSGLEKNDALSESDLLKDLPRIESFDLNQYRLTHSAAKDYEVKPGYARFYRGVRSLTNRQLGDRIRNSNLGDQEIEDLIAQSNSTNIDWIDLIRKHKSESAGSIFVGVSADQKIAKSWAGKNGFVLTIDVPIAELDNYLIFNADSVAVDVQRANYEEKEFLIPWTVNQNWISDIDFQGLSKPSNQFMSFANMLNWEELEAEIQNLALSDPSNQAELKQWKNLVYAGTLPSDIQSLSLIEKAALERAIVLDGPADHAFLQGLKPISQAKTVSEIVTALKLLQDKGHQKILDQSLTTLIDELEAVIVDSSKISFITSPYISQKTWEIVKDQFLKESGLILESEQVSDEKEESAAERISSIKPQLVQASAEAAKNILRELEQVSKDQKPKSQEAYATSIREVITTLEQTSGLVELPADIPNFVISDQHARPDYLINALQERAETSQGKMPVYEAMAQGLINVVCLGDGLHSENEDRWLAIDGANLAADSSLAKEMADGLNLMQTIMRLKTNFPNNFHYLRGNHDQINGTFTKFYQESQLVRIWLEANYGQSFIDRWERFENALPLLAVQKNSNGKTRVFSHAMPAKNVYDRGSNTQYSNLDLAAIKNKSEDAFWLLTWGDNVVEIDDADQTKAISYDELKETVLKLLTELDLDLKDVIWVVGHRHVEKDQFYRGELENHLIQFNHEEKQLVAIVSAERNELEIRDLSKSGLLDFSKKKEKIIIGDEALLSGEQWLAKAQQLVADVGEMVTNETVANLTFIELEQQLNLLTSVLRSASEWQTEDTQSVSEHLRKLAANLADWMSERNRLLNALKDKGVKKTVVASLVNKSLADLITFYHAHSLLNLNYEDLKKVENDFEPEEYRLLVDNFNELAQRADKLQLLPEDWETSYSYQQLLTVVVRRNEMNWKIRNQAALLGINQQVETHNELVELGYQLGDLVGKILAKEKELGRKFFEGETDAEKVQIEYIKNGEMQAPTVFNFTRSDEFKGSAEEFLAQEKESPVISEETLVESKETPVESEETSNLQQIELKSIDSQAEESQRTAFMVWQENWQTISEQNLIPEGILPSVLFDHWTTLSSLVKTYREEGFSKFDEDRTLVRKVAELARRIAEVNSQREAENEENEVIDFSAESIIKNRRILSGVESRQLLIDRLYYAGYLNKQDDGSDFFEKTNINQLRNKIGQDENDAFIWWLAEHFENDDHFGPTIKKMFDAKSNKNEHLKWMNVLIDFEVKAFFNQKGDLVSFSDYLKDVFAGVAEVGVEKRVMTKEERRRLVISLLGLESGANLTDVYSANEEELFAAFVKLGYPEFLLNDEYVARMIVINKEGKKSVYPILTGTIGEKSKASGQAVDSGSIGDEKFGLIFLNDSQEEGIFSKLTTLIHEVGHVTSFALGVQSSDPKIHQISEILNQVYEAKNAYLAGNMTYNEFFTKKSALETKAYELSKETGHSTEATLIELPSRLLELSFLDNQWKGWQKENSLASERLNAVNYVNKLVEFQANSAMSASGGAEAFRSWLKYRRSELIVEHLIRELGSKGAVNSLFSMPMEGWLKYMGLDEAGLKEIDTTLYMESRPEMAFWDSLSSGYMKKDGSHKSYTQHRAKYLVDKHGANTEAIKADPVYYSIIESSGKEDRDLFLVQLEKEIKTQLEKDEIALLKEKITDNKDQDFDAIVQKVAGEFIKNGVSKEIAETEKFQAEVLGRVALEVISQFSLVFLTKSDLLGYGDRVILLSDVFDQVLKEINSAVSLSPKLKEMLKFVAREGGAENTDQELIKSLIGDDNSEVVDEDAAKWAIGGKMDQLMRTAERANKLDDLMEAGLSYEDALKAIGGSIFNDGAQIKKSELSASDKNTLTSLEDFKSNIGQHLRDYLEITGQQANNEDIAKWLIDYNTSVKLLTDQLEVLEAKYSAQANIVKKLTGIREDIDFLNNEFGSAENITSNLIFSTDSENYYRLENLVKLTTELLEDVKTFNNTCSDCSQVREETEKGVSTAREIWQLNQALQVERQTKLESLAQAKVSKNRPKMRQLRAEIKEIEKRSADLRRQALDRIDQTRREVINTHSMQNQCVQFYLRAMADTLEAEIRQTRWSIWQAVRSVFRATEIAEEILASGEEHGDYKMQYISEPGFLGIGKQMASLDLEIEDVAQVEEMLNGNKDKKTEGLYDWAKFEGRKLVGGSLWQLREKTEIVSNGNNINNTNFSVVGEDNANEISEKLIKNILPMHNINPLRIINNYFSKLSNWSKELQAQRTMSQLVKKAEQEEKLVAIASLKEEAKAKPSSVPIPTTTNSPTPSLTSTPTPTPTETPKPTPILDDDQDYSRWLDELNRKYRRLNFLIYSISAVVLDLLPRIETLILEFMEMRKYGQLIGEYDPNDPYSQYLASIGAYEEFICGEDGVYYDNLADDIEPEKISQGACYRGAVLSNIGEKCSESELNYANAKNKCLLVCDNGYFVESNTCGQLRVKAFSNQAYWETHRILSVLPKELIESQKISVYVSALTYLPDEDNNSLSVAGFAKSSSITLRPIVLLGGNVNKHHLTHEYFHIWGAMQHRLYPDWAPYSYYGIIITEMFKKAGSKLTAPRDYEDLLGFEIENYVKYNSPNNIFKYNEGAYPVVNYGGLPPESIILSEDFADSAAWYVVNACELQAKSPIRYDYFRDEVFEGKEYLPVGGCVIN